MDAKTAREGRLLSLCFDGIADPRRQASTRWSLRTLLMSTLVGISVGRLFGTPTLP